MHCNSKNASSNNKLMRHLGIKKGQKQKKAEKKQKKAKLFGRIKIIPDLCAVERKFAEHEFLLYANFY